MLDSYVEVLQNFTGLNKQPNAGFKTVVRSTVLWIIKKINSSRYLTLWSWAVCYQVHRDIKRLLKGQALPVFNAYPHDILTSPQSISTFWVLSFPKGCLNDCYGCHC
uniref:Uncharacterized protein n=1 Tax=Sphaerodactylus townsendi TaxID=933632 RepID=A0ACB8FNK7_9SAUR